MYGISGAVEILVESYECDTKEGYVFCVYLCSRMYVSLLAKIGDLTSVPCFISIFLSRCLNRYTDFDMRDIVRFVAFFDLSLACFLV